MDASDGNTGEPASSTLLRKIDRILATPEAILMQSEETDKLLKEFVTRVTTMEGYVVFAEGEEKEAEKEY